MSKLIKGGTVVTAHLTYKVGVFVQQVARMERSEIRDLDPDP